MDRHDLCRSVPFEAVRADDGTHGDGLTLEGYGAVFGEPTVINSWEGHFTEKIQRGAFRKSLEERTPRVQFDHGMHPLIGSIPIGSINDIREDSRGLFINARLTDNWLIQPVRDAIANGSVDGMSFRFTVIRDEWHDADGNKVPLDEVYRRLDDGDLVRTLKEVRVSEVGPVVWPAYEATTVAVRSAGTVTIDLSRLRTDEEQRRNLDHLTALGRQILLSSGEDADPSAPPDTGHPDENRTDAPPDSAGHPSLSDEDAEHPETSSHKGRAVWPEYRDKLARIRKEK